MVSAHTIYLDEANLDRLPICISKSPIYYNVIPEIDYNAIFFEAFLMYVIDLLDKFCLLIKKKVKMVGTYNLTPEIIIILQLSFWSKVTLLYWFNIKISYIFNIVK